MDAGARWISRHPIPAFYGLAIAITWTGSLLYLQTRPEAGHLSGALALPFATLWYFGPCLAAVIVSRLADGPGAPRRLLDGLRRWKVGWRWYAFIVAYPLALHLAVVAADWASGGPAPVFFRAAGVPDGNVLLILLGLAVLQVLQRGLGEETGWRGFALPRLQAGGAGGLRASLILGALWAAWHFHPANFKALLSIGGGLVALNILLTAIVFTWVYNHTRGSLLIAVLFHMTLNVAEYVVPIGIADASLTRHLLQLALLVMVAAALVRTSGPSLGKEHLPAPSGGAVGPPAG